MKKRIIHLTLAMMLVLSLAVPSFAVDTFDYDVAYSWALEIGYPAEFLDLVSDDPSYLREIYYELKDMDEIEVSVSHEVMHFTTSDVQTRGNIDSSDLDFWMLAAKTSISGHISNVLVHVAYEWIGPVILEFTDAVTVNWDDSMWGFNEKTSNFEAEMRTGGIGGTAYNTVNQPAELNNGGIGWFCPLKFRPAIYGAASFMLYPIDSQLQNGDRYSSYLYATYAHQKYAASSIGLSIAGPSVTFTGTYDQLATSTTIKYGS